MHPAIRYTAAGLVLVSGIILIGVGVGFGIVPLIAGGVALIAVGCGIGFFGGSTPAQVRL